MKHYQVAAGIHAGRVNEASALASLLQAAGVNGKRFIIKVNWFGPEYGYFTDARTLDLVLSSLPPSEKIVVEGHAYGRNDGSREINWRDLNEAFDKWEWILQQEAWFLESTGLAEVLKKHGTKYINVTDEVWAGRAVSAEIKAQKRRRIGRFVQFRQRRDRSKEPATDVLQFFNGLLAES